jgi:hypothetical protein
MCPVNKTGYLNSQTGGTIDFGVADLRESVAGGGVLTIVDYTPNNPSDNAGFISIHDSVIKNLITALSQTGQVVTPINCPQQCNAIVSVSNTTLSIAFSTTAPEITTDTIRNVEPIYPVENFTNAPLLAINSYKHITTNLSTDATGAPTRWSGTNLFDVRYVLI